MKFKQCPQCKKDRDIRTFEQGACKKHHGAKENTCFECRFRNYFMNCIVCRGEYPEYPKKKGSEKWDV